MSPTRPFPLVLLIAVSAAFYPASAQDQNPATTAKKPVRKPDQVPNDDSVVLLAVPIASEKLAPTPQPSCTPSRIADETHKKAADIIYLESQIQQKTERIYFLMRLFVTDERPFLNDPANQNIPEATHDRRKYEQDELLWETAELARLKHRLNELKAAK